MGKTPWPLGYCTPQQWDEWFERRYVRREPDALPHPPGCRPEPEPVPPVATGVGDGKPD